MSEWICLLLILISRLPFINLGYGSEEDAWGLRITAEQISRTGIYEVSRLPGHPLQELVYAQLWQYGPLAFNLLTLIVSTVGIAFFMGSLKKLKITSYLAAGVALSLTPVVFLNSMNAMDYTWAMSFILIAVYLLITERLLWAGVFLGLAVGCRITSGAMLIPFVVYLLNTKNIFQSTRKILITVIAALTISGILFLPVYAVYGISFFRYYEYFAIPSMAKSFYKGTIGVWGIIGFTILFLALCRGFINLITNYKAKLLTVADQRIMIFCSLAIVLFALAFIQLPLKSAFLIPIIPFVMLIVAQNVNSMWMNGLALAMLASCFLCGVNLSDPNRGSEASWAAINVKISSQQVSFDPLIGPVMADYTKQKNIIRFSREVILKANQLGKRSVIIAGWYLNFILTLKDNHQGSNIFVYYIDEQTIRSFIEKGFSVYYLSEQEQFNDLRFHGKFTEKYALPLSVVKDVQKP